MSKPASVGRSCSRLSEPNRRRGERLVEASQFCCSVGRLASVCSAQVWNRVEVAQPSREHIRHAAPALAREVDCAPRAVDEADFVVTTADVAPIADSHIAEVRGPPGSTGPSRLVREPALDT
jgi:hypothetical protein